MALIKMETHSTPKYGPKGVELPKITAFDGVSILIQFKEVPIEYLIPFVKEILNDGSTNAVIDSVIKNDKTKLLHSLKQSGRNGANCHDENGNTPLMFAAQSGQVNLVKTLQTEGATLQSQTLDGKTALYLATVNNHTNVVYWLASQGADVNIADKEGITPLLISAYQGNVTLAKTLITNGAQIDWQDQKGRTALMAASQEGHIEIVQLFLKKNSNSLVQTNSGKTALFYAAMKGHMNVVELLVKSCGNILNLPDKCWISVLMTCSLHGRMEMVKGLISFEADVNQQDEQGKTAIMAAIQGGHFDIVQLLLENRASVDIETQDKKCALLFAVSLRHLRIVEVIAPLTQNINHEDENGDTTLIVAASNNDTRSVEVLINASVDINYQNVHGKTALMYASLNGHTSMVTLLLKNSADLQLENANGMTALDLASFKQHTDVVGILQKAGGKRVLTPLARCKQLLVASSQGNKDIVKQLVSKGADVNFKDERGCTSLMLSSQAGHASIVSFLLEREANVNQSNVNGVNVLAYAMKSGNRQIIDVLLGYGVNTMHEDNEGQTLLYSCAANGHTDKLKEILQLGVNIDHKCKGKTSLMIACENGFLEIVNYLVKMGVSTDIHSAEGFKAVDYAFMKNHVEIQELLMSSENMSDSDIQKGNILLMASARSDVKTVEVLAMRPSIINYRDTELHGLTPLIQASQKGHMAVVDILCSHKAKVNLKTTSGDTALLLTALEGHLEIIQILLEHEACPNLTDNKGRTALMCASQNGHRNIVDILVKKGALLNLQDYHGFTALMFATFSGNLDVVVSLLGHSAKVDLADNDKHTPLLIAALSGYVPIMEVLLEHGANINFKDFFDRNVLMAASQKGHMEAVKCLVKNGATLDEVTSTGMTAMDYAMMKGHFDVGNWLCDQGAKPGIAGAMGQYKASERTTQKEKEAMGLTGHVSSRRQNQAQKDLIDMCKGGWGFEDAVSYTILNGANVNQPDAKGRIPLLVAVQGRHFKHVKWLLNMGSDVNVTDSSLKTPLMYAAEFGNLDLVQALIEHRADINAVDAKGKDALSYARNSSNNEIASYLMKHIDMNPRKDSQKSSASDGSIEALFSAIHQGDLTKIEELLNTNIELQSKDSDKRNALSHCALANRENSHVIVNLLCGIGVQTECSDINNDTPLLLGIRNSNLAVVKELVSCNANVLHYNKYKQNSLIEACVQGSQEMVELLLNKFDKFSKKSISVALNLVITSNNIGVFTLFIEKGHKIIIELINEEELFFVCVTNNQTDLVRCMLANGLQINGQNSSGKTALMISSEGGLLEMTKILLEQGANVHCIDKEGQSALTLSLDGGYFEITQMLWEYTFSTGDYVMTSMVMQRLNVIVVPALGSDNQQEEQNRTEIGTENILFQTAKSDITEQLNEDVQLAFNQTMKALYKMFTLIIIKESPDCIKGFSRDWIHPIIYINIDEGKKESAVKFIEEKVKKPNIQMNIVNFEYIVEPNDATYLMDSQNNSGNEITQCKTINPPKSGSILFKVKTDSNNTRRLLKSEIKKEDLSNIFSGTLTCFMHRHGGADVDNSQVWGVSVGHTFLEKVPFDPRKYLECNRGDYILSEYTLLRCGETEREEIRTCILADCYYAAIEHLERDDGFPTVDVFVFPIYEGTQRDNLYDLSIEGLDKIPDVFTGADMYLRDRMVYKIGHKSGKTYGHIIEVEQSCRIEKTMHHGLFTVKSEDDSIPFAQKGDSGSAVIDAECGLLLGIICGIATLDKHLIYCSRLDNTLEYVERKWNILLSFNNQASEESRAASQVPQDCQCGLSEEMLVLKKEIHQEKQKRNSEEAFFANFKYTALKQQGEMQACIKKLHGDISSLKEENDRLTEQIQESS